ncbi:MAG: hypothetical protein ACI906_000715 [Candidatus Latescibacterota bacterium]|jgi:hypothetical protein
MSQRAFTRPDRSAEWRRKSAILVSGLLLFETLTGLGIWLLPFSLPLQFSVLVHTAVGLIFVLPYAWYQLHHWRVYRHAPMTHVKLTGYLALVSTLICSASGLVLSYQAAFATRISYGWDLAHIASTLALVACALPHVVALLLRDRRSGASQAPVLAAERSFGLGTALYTLGGLVLIAAWTLAYDKVEWTNEFPPDYDLQYGNERPFAPSLATTASGGAYDGRSLGGSQSCGTSGCHEEITREWEVSAHRYASMDVAFQAVQKTMAEQNGATSTRYCGGCHDPISLFSGTKNIFVENLTSLDGYQEGISCIACHAIKQTDVKGNANYTIAQPERYAYELREGGGSTPVFLRDFLIRSYPRHHVESLSHRLFKSPEFCAACHKQFIDAEINNVGWVQLQNQYDNWRKSRWNHRGDPTKTVECRECHMPLIALSAEPGSGDPLDYNRASDDGKHRSHRFLGANQFLPLVHELPGAKEQVQLTEMWLRGEIPIPEIADKWKHGPAVPIELLLPEKATPGEKVDIRVVITNNKTGHDFPTGPLDIIQAWVELEVYDEEGTLVHHSGAIDDKNFIEQGSFIFKAEAVDQYGNLIDRHNLWEMVGVRFKRSLFPGFADAAEFSMVCPTAVVGEEQTALPPEERFSVEMPQKQGKLYVQAKLQYRKIDQYLLNFLMGEDSGITAPITTISEAHGTIPVRDDGLGMTAPPGVPATAGG